MTPDTTTPMAESREDGGAGLPADDYATEAELRELFDLEPDDTLEDVIPVCEGEWRKVWRIFRYDDEDAEDAPAPASDAAAVVEAARAGWNACRKSVYAVCEDAANEADKHRGDPENEHRSAFGRGAYSTAKSIARGFNAMEADDDDHFTAALAALLSQPTEAKHD